MVTNVKLKWKFLSSSILLISGCGLAQTELSLADTQNVMGQLFINSPANLQKNSTATRLELPPSEFQYEDLSVPTGLFGLPFAPVGLTGCDEMRFYREQFGLPEIFDRIGYRESRCTNREDVRTYCCHGYWQLYFSIHTKDNRLAPHYERCGVVSVSDYNGSEPLDKQKQACVAKALYDLMGTQPWVMTR